MREGFAPLYQYHDEINQSFSFIHLSQVYFLHILILSSVIKYWLVQYCEHLILVMIATVFHEEGMAAFKIGLLDNAWVERIAEVG